MKRESKVVMIGVIRLAIVIALGIVGLKAGQLGWAGLMLVTAICMAVDSYKRYKDENYKDEVEEESEFEKWQRTQDMLHYHNEMNHHHDDRDSGDDQDTIV